ncbi:MAG TPA: efflux RND transporter permease subunit [Sandaracinaceae bacterium LLY-WYZ-13_1]|nr:efflux RND transporter permease subunit [Sandaracinaceae bacterium LLY-WYZ-13_1]
MSGPHEPEAGFGDGSAGEPPPEKPGLRKGALAWMAQNSVASNVLMLILIAGGLLMIPQIKQEVFPEFDLDMVLINVPYPGASPEEVEQGVILPIEEAVRGVDGIKEVRSTAQEGVGVVTLELLLGADADRVLADVKSAVDRITSFPTDVEEPVVSRPALRGEVISLVVHGDASESQIRSIADRVRDDLLAEEGITTIELSGVRPLEISVEIPQERLRAHGLTHGQVADAIRAASIDVPGGTLKTTGGEVLLRTTERRDRGGEFEDIVVRSRPDGSQITVGDLGEVTDGFQEIDTAATYEGQRAVMVQVYRVGSQTPLDIAATVHEYIAQHEQDLPPGVHFATWNDRSEIYEDRIDLLLKNAYLGLILVLVCLGLFLEIRLAFWVTLGIPISFVGSLLFMPSTDASINMISLFAFILTLGMVVDDAIVVGEAIYKKLTDGLPPMRAAIEGVKEVAGPVVFAILTTCIAFSPLLFVPGTFGKFFMQIPIVVILVLLLSLVESLLVLPAHLGHIGETQKYLVLFSGICFVVATGALGLARVVESDAVQQIAEFALPIYGVSIFCLVFLGMVRWKGLMKVQQRFSRLVEWLIDRTYAPTLKRALHWRYFTLATAFAILFASCGLVGGGRVETTFFPKIDSDIISAKLEMPFGTPATETERIQRRLLETSREVVRELAPQRGEDVVRGRFALLGATGAAGGGPGSGQRDAGGHIAEVAVFTVPSDERPFSARQFAEAWRDRVGDIPGVESLSFSYSTGGPSGADIDFQLSHPNLDILERAAGRMAEGLGTYAGVREIDDGFTAGKEQLDFTLRPEARARGITEQVLARQLRDAFFGAEAVRQQRGRDEIRVYVRRPREERESLADIENLLVRTPDGGEIPLTEAAEIERGRSYTKIQRLDGRRRVNVTAGVEFGTNANRVQSQAQEELVPQLLEEFPGLRIEPGGQAKRQAETMSALGMGFLLALLGMFALLAIAFRSYAQPFIIISAIPFGIVGAIIGHLLLGYDLSLMSMMGVVALAGVVVNDSLVLVSAVNDYRRDEGLSLLEAVKAGGVRRFRPILLTSLTTFLGLTPMILETSVGARFLIPMAISLGFGVLFATFITLLLVPCLYLIFEDLGRLLARMIAFFKQGFSGEPPPADAPVHSE